MYKNQLQELAQRSCFNLPSYACIREGPDHAPRFRASVNFHGEIFEGPSYCPTLRQAEHAAAEVALNNLSTRGGTSRSLAARVLDETGVYKNLLQETAHRAGLKLPVYTTVRSGPGHQPVFTCSVELAGMSFHGEPAKTKKQAEKNAAMAAWSALKQMPNLDSLKEVESVGEEQEQVIVAKVLSNFKPKEENRQIRQRDQQRRRMASPHCSLLYRNQWRSNDPFSDNTSIYHQSSTQQNQRGFLALPHPNGPKILPPLPYLNHSSTNTTIQEPSSSFAKNNNIPCLLQSTRPIPPLEECQKDDDDWTSDTSHSKGKSIVRDTYLSKPTQAYGPTPDYHRTMPLPYQRTRPFSPPPHSRPSTRNSMLNLIPRTIGSGGFHGIAPAVHVRSVIPVCAVPPPPMRPPQNNSVTPQNNSATQKKETEEEVSAATSKLNRLQL